MENGQKKDLLSKEESVIMPTNDELRIIKNLREKAGLMQYGTITMDVRIDFSIHEGQIKKGEIIEIKPRL